MAWDVASGGLRDVLDGHLGGVFAMTFLGRRPLFVSGGQDGALRWWSTDTLRTVDVAEGHRDTIWSVAASPAGDLVASASQDGTVRLWDTSARGFARGFEPRAVVARVWFIAFSPDGSKLVASGDEGRPVTVWDFSTGKVLAELDTQSGTRGVSFSPDGTTVAVASRKGAVRLWGFATGTDRSLPMAGGGYVRHVAFSPDGHQLAAGTRSGEACVWDVTKAEKRLCVEGNMGVSFSPDGRVLATGDRDKGVKLWDAVTGAPLRHLEGHEGLVDAVSLSHDGQWLASTDQVGGVRLWDLGHGAQPYELTGHTQWVNSVSFSRDDRFLVTASDDWTIRVWSVAERRAVLVLHGAGECMSAAFSPDGKWLAVDWYRDVRLFPLDLSIREADPDELRAQAEKEAGMKLVGFGLVPSDGP
jgi:WD40 repeat protein